MIKILDLIPCTSVCDSGLNICITMFAIPSFIILSLMSLFFDSQLETIKENEKLDRKIELDNKKIFKDEIRNKVTKICPNMFNVKFYDNLQEIRLYFKKPDYYDLDDVLVYKYDKLKRMYIFLKNIDIFEMPY